MTNPAEDLEGGTMAEDAAGSYNSGSPVDTSPPPTMPSSFRGSFFQKRSNRETQDLAWSHVNLTLKNKKGNETEKHILTNVWGEARGGETTAIMGASGAGKTSLFNVLAGRVRSRGRIEVQANIRLGDNAIDPNHNYKIRTMFAFVAQEDALHEPSTPRQALQFSARLRLPKSTTKKEIDDLVETYIKELGIASAADTIIGGGLRKGISGGEKRRVSIGVELISQPNIIFLDEPTSGLDSFAAKQVMGLLQKVAKAGNIVLFTIHQPSSDVFASFDRLILLHKARLMYSGLVSNITRDFEANHFPIPPNYNPADWILDVAQKGFFPQDDRPERKALEAIVVPRRDHASTWTQLVMLICREKIGILKNPVPMIINASITGFLSVVFGVIFFQVGASDRSNSAVLQGQLGALTNVNIATMMGQAQTALAVFSSERQLFLREYSTDHYSITPYFISHLATEALQALVAMLVQAFIVYFMIGLQQTFFQFFFVTFTLAMTSTAVAVLLGSFFSDSKNAQSLFTLVVVPQMYFFWSFHFHQPNPFVGALGSVSLFADLCFASIVCLRVQRLRAWTCDHQL